MSCQSSRKAMYKNKRYRPLAFAMNDCRRLGESVQIRFDNNSMKVVLERCCSAWNQRYVMAQKSDRGGAATI